MTDDTKLNTLKDAPVPAPRADARARALAAARAAFDSASQDVVVGPGLRRDDGREQGLSVRVTASHMGTSTGKSANEVVSLIHLPAHVKVEPSLSPLVIPAQAGTHDNFETESPNTTQAIVPLARPTEDINAPRRRFMLSRHRALAASLAALCIAAPVFFALKPSQPIPTNKSVTLDAGASTKGQALPSTTAQTSVATVAVPSAAANPSTQSMPGLVITPPPPPRALTDADASRQADKAAAERAPQMAQISENKRGMVGEYRRQNEELRNMAPAAKAAIAPGAAGAPSAPLSPAPTSEPVTRKSGFLTPSTGEQQPSRELAEVDAARQRANEKAKAEATKRASTELAGRDQQRAAAKQALSMAERELDQLKAMDQRGLVTNDRQARLEREVAQLREASAGSVYDAVQARLRAEQAGAAAQAAPHVHGTAHKPEIATRAASGGEVPLVSRIDSQATDAATVALNDELARAAGIPQASKPDPQGLSVFTQGARIQFGDVIPTTRPNLRNAEQLLADLRAKTERGEFDRTRLAEFEQNVQHQRTQIAALQQEQERALREAQEQRDRFQALEQNPIKKVADEPVSTFSLDVDTASYALARRQLNAGRLPRTDSIRVEEFINYFPYTYARPESVDAPFAPQITVVPSPWNANTKLVHIGVKGYALNDVSRPRANLVLLVDISGSMQPSDRLPLLKSAFRMLVDQLRPHDTIGIVTYASGSDILLAPTRVENRATILAAIDSLNAGGSTSGARGLEDAYRLAEANFDKGGVNRIILGTDGDWNVGITNREQLKGYIERKREMGIFLSILGVGMGNYNDALMQTLARNGNGVAAYIDTLNEARKVLVDEASSSIFPIAKDVKVQIEFNPQTVSEYRLIGYEKRILKREDFNNDKVDAGDVGAGHTVTAIYEITPVNAVASSDPLRYGQPVLREPIGMNASEYGFLKLRYKLPKEDTSRLITQPIVVGQQTQSFAVAPTDVRFSIAVAAFGQKLRGSPHLKDYRYDDIISLAADARGDDPFGYRAEFLNLVRLAKSAAP